MTSLHTANSSVKFTGLLAYSTYNLTVTATHDAYSDSNTSTVQFTTPSAGIKYIFVLLKFDIFCVH